MFFTSIPPAEQRRLKLWVDVAPNRAGAAAGAALITLATMWWAPRFYAVLLLAAIACAGIAAVLAARLTRAYLGNLERSLIRRGAELDLAGVGDLTTRTAMLRTSRRRASASVAPTTGPASVAAEGAIDNPHLRGIQALRSRDRERVRAVLRAPDGVGALVQYVVPLLAWDPVAEEAVRALRMVAEEHVGALVDALLNPSQSFVVRRRLARVFSVCVSQRAADGLVLGLDDQRFEVRFHCARSLASILQKNAAIRIDRERVFNNVMREIAVGRPVWETHRLLDGVDGGEDSFVDEFVKDRAGQGLAHVFTLLSLVLPTEPLQIAYRGLHAKDEGLRGTALEYLEGVLPPAIHARLSPFLGGAPRPPGPRRSREEILATLLQSNEKIVLNLEELHRRIDT